MACFILAIILSVFCILTQSIESPNRRESSSTINKSLTSNREETSSSQVLLLRLYLLRESNQSLSMPVTLPPSSDTACSSVNARTHLMQSKITSDTFQAYILDEYELCELRSNKKDSKDKAFTADASKKKPKKDIECHNCHKCGHIKADCWAKGGGKEGQRPKCNNCANMSMAAAAEEPELGAWVAIQNVEDKTNNNQQNYAAAIAGRSLAHAEQLQSSMTLAHHSTCPHSASVS